MGRVCRSPLWRYHPLMRVWPSSWLATVVVAISCAAGATLAIGGSLADADPQLFAAASRTCGDASQDPVRSNTRDALRMDMLASVGRKRLGIRRYGGIWTSSDTRRIQLGIVGSCKDAPRQIVRRAQHAIRDANLRGAVDIAFVDHSEAGLLRVQRQLERRLSGANRGAEASVNAIPDFELSLVRLEVPPRELRADRQSAAVRRIRADFGRVVREVRGPGRLILW